MKTIDYAVSIIEELRASIVLLNNEEINGLIDALIRADRIFIAGTGRSGMMMKAFSMRLMHLGLVTYVIGESTTPGITKNDFLLVGSGSGQTRTLLTIAEKTASIDTPIGLITIDRDSPIALLANVVVVIKAPSPKVSTHTFMQSIQPMASLFEQCLLILLDAIVIRIMNIKRINPDAMFGLHANLE